MLQRRRPARPCNLHFQGAVDPFLGGWLGAPGRERQASGSPPHFPTCIAARYVHRVIRQARSRLLTSPIGEVPTRARKSTLRKWDKVTPVTFKVTHRAQVDTYRAQGDTFPPQVDTFRPEGGTFTAGPCQPCKLVSPCGARPLRSAGSRASRGFPGSRTRCRRSRGNKCLCSHASRRPRRR